MVYRQISDKLRAAVSDGQNTYRSSQDKTCLVIADVKILGLIIIAADEWHREKSTARVCACARNNSTEIRPRIRPRRDVTHTYTENKSVQPSLEPEVSRTGRRKAARRRQGSDVTVEVG